MTPKQYELCAIKILLEIRHLFSLIVYQKIIIIGIKMIYLRKAGVLVINTSFLELSQGVELIN